METYSSRRDVVLTMARRVSERVELMLMSVRSSGCAARIVLLVERGRVFDDAWRDLLADLQVEVVEQDDIDVDIMHKKIELYREWLEKHVEEVDRIFCTDSTDVFFQRDPFRTLVVPGRITFAIEFNHIFENRMNGNWVRDKGCFGEEGYERVKHGWLVCAGTMAGPGREYLEFLRVLTEPKESWRRCVNDQPVVNYKLWSGEFEQHGVLPNLIYCNDTIISLAACPRQLIGLENSALFDVASSLSPEPVAVVHHYRWWDELVQNYYRRCGGRRFA